MGATCQMQAATGAGPTLANAEGGIHFSREDTVNGSTTPIPIPTTTGTHFSYVKWLGLIVTGTAATTISNRRVAWASGPATGLVGWFEGNTTYTQNNGTQGTAAGNYPADAGSNGATPAGPGTFTQLSTSNQVYDSASVSAGSTGLNGKYCMLVVGVDNSFTGGAGANTALPDLTFTYDEQ